MCQKVGLSGDETQSLMSKIGDQEIKDKLKETTQKALDMGVSRLEIYKPHVFVITFSLPFFVLVKKGKFSRPILGEHLGRLMLFYIFYTPNETGNFVF